MSGSGHKVVTISKEEAARRTAQRGAEWRLSSAGQELQRYQATTSTAPIKIMTIGLISLTLAFAYDLWSRKRFPHQHGADLRDLFREQ